ncbi:MAG: aminotransferase class V-fold PLP-dependent enzyme [Anaerolineae bacterium]|nr:aminotransferase class V-fold PLP-dependent enzyme [Anaerolineae bacterium]
MKEEPEGSIYGDLGVRPAINATGYQLTRLGGSMLSPRVQAAMQDANHYFVDMEALLERSGRIIADLLEAEAALVTSGCCAALALGAAACLAGDDPRRIEQLPDVTGMKHEIICQKHPFYRYDRCVTVPGARLVDVGGALERMPEQLEAAIGEGTAAILVWASREGPKPAILEKVIRVGHRHGVPVIVDAATQVYPLDEMKRYPAMGADLVCYGAKYFGAPNSTGLLCGRRDLVEAASKHGFVAFETDEPRPIGRPMKLDRQEIIAVVVALQEWFAMDHAARLDGYRRRAQRLAAALQGTPQVRVSLADDPSADVRLVLDEAALGRTAEQLSAELRDGDPSIWVRVEQEALVISTATMRDGDEAEVAERLNALLTRSSAEKSAQ